MKKENEIRVLMVEPNEHLKEFLLKNTLQAMQEAVGGLIDIVDIDDDGIVKLFIFSKSCFYRKKSIG